MSPRRIIGAVIVALLLVGGAVILLSLDTASNDRVWLEEYERTASADISESSVAIRNVRDWAYDREVLSRDWRDVTVDPNALVRAWFIIEPFGPIEGIGHTFLSFEFSDSTILSFSIQARQEAAEKYSAVRGLANTYELAYQWGTERDFVARRLLYLNHDIRMYPLAIPPDDAKRLFISVLEETNEVAREPRFYNTLSANCTNMLAKIVNEHYPGRLPYDLSWNLTGYSDIYLMEEGLITMEGSSEATRVNGDLTPHREAVRAIATSSPPAFSAAIRAFLEGTK